MATLILSWMMLWLCGWRSWLWRWLNMFTVCFCYPYIQLWFLSWWGNPWFHGTCLKRTMLTQFHVGTTACQNLWHDSWNRLCFKPRHTFLPSLKLDYLLNSWFAVEHPLKNMRIIGDHWIIIPCLWLKRSEWLMVQTVPTTRKMSPSRILKV